jgi:hypothetical protein
MPVPVTSFFEFIEKHPLCVVNRYEVDAPEFGALRRNIRQMLVGLRESEDQEALQLSDGLRTLISNWLTTPVLFDEKIPEQLSAVMGPPDMVGIRWGRDIQELHAAALEAAQNLVGKVNPLRERLEDIIAHAMVEGKCFRIFCHKSAIGYFKDLASTDAFIHSPAGYREAEPFDLMIKIGPLRSHGWGAVPDALISASKFARLDQLVWVGCADEDGFGFDPVSALQSTGQSGIRGNAQTRETKISAIGSRGGQSPDLTQSDEFLIFSNLKEKRDLRKATLVQIEDESGLLYPYLSRVISFDPNPQASEPIAKRLVDENLSEGMFLVRHAAHDPTESEIHAEHGYFSRIWKAKLQNAINYNLDELCKKLRTSGVHLDGLPGAVRHWAKSPTTVIHAPQRRTHFEALIEVLEIDKELPSGTPERLRRTWWMRAWSEVAASRGVAIQAGVHGHESLEEELMDVLLKMLPEIRLHPAQGESSFSMDFPEDSILQGVAFFDRIVSIERGFKAPDSELRAIQSIENLEQWRA